MALTEENETLYRHKGDVFIKGVEQQCFGSGANPRVLRERWDPDWAQPYAEEP